MKITDALIESLLHESEGPALDFKRAQYQFERAGDDIKSELLKDVIAFANTFRRTDAFVLIGVEEVKDGRSVVRGVSTHLEDASLQQFVNRKTNRQVEFSYQAIEFDGQSIGVLHIPIQQRPLYCKVKYGRVVKDAVYLRRGSSTDIASPDEIAQMGRLDLAPHEDEPSLTLGMFDRETGASIEEEAVAPIHCISIELPDGHEVPNFVSNVGFAAGLIDNRHYYRDVVKYCQEQNFLKPISLYMANNGRQPALDVRLVIEIEDLDESYGFCGELDMCSTPDRSHDVALMAGIRGINAPPQQVDASKLSGKWLIECRFGKIQPQDRVDLREDLFVGARKPGTLTLPGTVYADNLSHPRSMSLDLSIESLTRQLSPMEIVKRYERAASPHFED